MYRLALFSYCLLSLTPLFSQIQRNSPYRISGNITNQQTKSPVEFASVLLMSTIDSSQINGVVSDSIGFFQITDTPAGRYYVRISFVGYQSVSTPAFDIDQQHPTKSLGEIVLSANDQRLDEVVIKAEQQPIVRQPGKTILNIESSIFKTDNTASDLLLKAPGLNYDINGELVLRGTIKPVITINGKESELSLAEIQSIPADNIQNIEIISNPSARYDGEWPAVINIILKKRLQENYSGSVYGNIGRNRYTTTAAGANLNVNTKKWLFFGSYDINQNRSYTDITINSRFTDSPITAIITETNIVNVPLRNQVFFSADYLLNQTNTLSIFLRGSWVDSRDDYISTSRIDRSDESVESIANNNQLVENSDKFAVNLSYQRDFSEGNGSFFFNYDYILMDQKQSQDIETVRLPSNALFIQTRIDNSTAYNIHTMRADYERALTGGQLSFGVKGSLVENTNNNTYDTLLYEPGANELTEQDQFMYEENVYAGYATYSIEGEQWQTTLGLRAEVTDAVVNSLAIDSVVNRNFTNLLPSASVSYRPNDHTFLNLNYARKIRRPYYNRLNPFRRFIDPFTINTGNPFLLPVKTNNVEFSFSFKDFSTSLAYFRLDDIVNQIIEQDSESGVSVLIYQNLDNKTTWSWDAQTNFLPTSWWSIQPYLIVSHDEYELQYKEQPFVNSRWSYRFNVTNSFTLPGDLVMNVQFFYQSPFIFNLYEVDKFYQLSAGISKEFFEKKLKINFNAGDIFQTFVQRSSVNQFNLDTDFKQLPANRFINLRVSYRFGGSKRNNSKSPNVEEEGRIG